MRKYLVMILISFFCACVGIVIFYDKPAQILESQQDIHITHIVVEKAKRTLSLYAGDEIIKTYAIALGKNPIGHKQFEGDSKTPEGEYVIDSKNPKSRYFLNLGISYPNEADKAYAQNLNKSAGGDIKIHGLPNGFGFAKGIFKLYGDWTDGCIGVDNESMQEIYQLVPIGTTITILP